MPFGSGDWAEAPIKFFKEDGEIMKPNNCYWCNGKTTLGSSLIGNYVYCCREDCNCRGPIRCLEHDAIQEWNSLSLNPNLDRANRRERFVMAAMQGLCADFLFIDRSIEVKAVEIADATIAELDKLK